MKLSTIDWLPVQLHPVRAGSGVGSGVGSGRTSAAQAVTVITMAIMASVRNILVMGQFSNGVAVETFRLTATMGCQDSDKTCVVPSGAGAAEWLGNGEDGAKAHPTKGGKRATETPWAHPAYAGEGISQPAGISGIQMKSTTASSSPAESARSAAVNSRRTARWSRSRIQSGNVAPALTARFVP